MFTGGQGSLPDAIYAAAHRQRCYFSPSQGRAMLSLLAEAAIEAAAISPVFSLLLQGGSFGLLTYMVTVQWPRWLREAREEREKRDVVFQAVIEALEKGFVARNSEMVTANKESAERIERAIGMACKANLAKI